MSWRNISIIFRKELVDLLRDRKTLIFMVLLPVLVIPGMMWIMNRFVESGVKRLTEESSIIAVVGGDNAPAFIELLDRLADLGSDPGALAGIDEPLLTDGLNHMLTADELLDAMLLSGAIEGIGEEEQDRLGSARFLETVAYEPDGAALATAFGDGSTDFLRDARTLRLATSARSLRSLDDVDTLALFRRDATLVADRQRLEGMSAAERGEVEAQVALLDAIAAELSVAAQEGRYHAILVVHDGFLERLRADGTAHYSLLYDEAREKSAAARQKVDRFLERLGEGVVRARVENRALERGLLDPFAGAELNLGRGRNLLAILLPYMVLLMCFLGAIYPAIDLGAGEKERGTLETLLVTPAERLEFVLGKFGMITLAAMVATLLSVGSLVVSARLGLLSAPGMLGGIEYDPTAIAVSLILMVPVAALFAAVLLATSIYAKSFKEAQSYSTPINMAILLPALVSFVPGIELTIPLSFVPLVNVSLALKEAWAGIFKWDCLAVILASSAVYAGAALLFCSKWFQREEVLFRT